MNRLPKWMRTTLRTDREFSAVHNLLAELKLNTVCRSAHCPNIHECWNSGTATMMILGDTCTRACRFCAVDTGRPAGVDKSEPHRVAQGAKEMGLRFVVITSVTRDDLPDGGAGVFAQTIQALKQTIPGVGVEVLTPDFQGREEALATVLRAEPDVFAHNVETVARLQPLIRPQAPYRRSLEVLRFSAAWKPHIAVKSGLMLGLGETPEEIERTMYDLVDAGCELLTLGQYLAPSRRHAQVVRYVSPEEFDNLAERARKIGFKAVASAPLVRSSYRADELLAAVEG